MSLEGISNLAGGAAGVIGSIFDFASDEENRDLQLQLFNRQFDRSVAVQDRDFQFNTDEARRGREFAHQEAELNRAWQERMSNSAWQRSRDDMAAAGFNPMLTFMKGGASTPPGATASASSGHSSAGGGPAAPHLTAPKIGQAIRDSVNSALAVKRLQKDVEATDAVIALNEAAKVTEEKKAAVQANSAKSLELQNRLQEAQLPAKKKQAEYDEKFAPADAILRRAQELLGAWNSGASAYRQMRPRIKIEDDGGPSYDQLQRENRTLKKFYERHNPLKQPPYLP